MKRSARAGDQHRRCRDLESPSAPQLLREFKRSIETYFASARNAESSLRSRFPASSFSASTRGPPRDLPLLPDREAKSINKWG